MQLIYLLVTFVASKSVFCLLPAQANNIDVALEKKNNGQVKGFGYNSIGSVISEWSFNAGTSHMSHYKSEQVFLEPDVGLYPFLFGEPGTYAKQNYVRDSPNYELLEVFDCYCGGDEFAIFDNGKFVNDVNMDCENAQPNCKTFSDIPKHCYYSGLHEKAWCKVKAILAPGKHNISIGVISNMYHSGTGFVRLSALCQHNGATEQCCVRDQCCKFDVVGDKSSSSSSSSTKKSHHVSRRRHQHQRHHHRHHHRHSHGHGHPGHCHKEEHVHRQRHRAHRHRPACHLKPTRISNSSESTSAFIPPPKPQTTTVLKPVTVTVTTTSTIRPPPPPTTSKTTTTSRHHSATKTSACTEIHHGRHHHRHRHNSQYHNDHHGQHRRHRHARKHSENSSETGYCGCGGKH